MTDNRPTRRYGILFALANVLMLGLCALLWISVFSHKVVYEQQIVATQTPFQLSLDQVQQYSWTVSAIKDETDLSMAITDSDGNVIYQTRLHMDDLSGEGVYAQMTAVDDSMNLTAGAEYTIDFYLDGGSEYDGQGYVAFYGVQTTLAVWYCSICIGAWIICNLILLLIWWARKGETGRIKVLTVLILLFLGILVNVMYPPLNVPDEMNHFLATYSVSGQMMPDGSDEDYVITQIPTGIQQNMGNLSVAQQIYSFWYDHAYGDDVSTQSTWRFNRGVNYANYGYYPSAAGLTVARAMHAPYQAIILVGRMCNYIAFLLLAGLACKAAPDLHMAGLAIAGLPSTIWLVTSYSYDGWNLGFTILFVAYLWRLTTYKEKIGILQILAMVVMLLAFGPIKYIYVILGLLVFAIPVNRWKNLKIIIGAIIVGGIGGVIVLRSRLAEVLRLLFTTATDERGLEQGLSGSSYTVSYVLHHPLQIALTFIKTFYTDLEDMIEKLFVGEFHADCVPGVLTVAIGIFIVLLFLVSTRETLSGRTGTGHGTRTAWLYRGVFALGLFAVYGSFLFLYSYYNEGEIGVISGVQGRYFLPLVLLLAPAGSARLATRCGAWLERHRIQPMQILGGLLYVSVLVLLCRIPGFIE